MKPKNPCIHASAYIDPTAVIIGAVDIEKECGVYPQTVIRGDQNSIAINEQSNIQDCCVIHVDKDHAVSIGKQVSIGHGAVVHGATIQDNCIIGMHATILNGAVIKKGSIIGAHALVTSNTVIPEHSLVVGIPGKVIKQDETYETHAIQNAETYIHLSKQYKNNVYPRYKQ